MNIYSITGINYLDWVLVVVYRICMKGNIYADKCQCGGKMVHDDSRNNCFCSVCDFPASKGYIVRFGRDLSKRFKTYAEASQFLSGLRFKTAEGSFNKRDYLTENPLLFSQQIDKWLRIKKQTLNPRSFNNLRRYIYKALDFIGDKNIKHISSGDIEDFLYAPETAASSKTRHDIRSVVNQFFSWLSDREDIKKPKIPKIEYELGWRKITTLEIQQSIIDEVLRIAPPKVAFGIDLLALYPKLRPDDLRRINEGDYIDGVIRITNPTKRKNHLKIVKLVDDHIEQWKEFQKRYPALPHMPFFRHHGKGKGYKPDQQYGKDHFYRWWCRACDNLGIKGLDLYGGTRHTIVTEIAKSAGSAAAKKASAHETNKAFERYCQAEDETAFQMAKMIRGKKDVVRKLYKDSKNN